VPSLLIICRQGSDFLLPDFKRGAKCTICGKELQVSPGGQMAIAGGARPFCNPCGLTLVKKIEASGLPHDWLINPACAKRIDEILAELKDV
jgi:ribosomal protein S27E